MPTLPTNRTSANTVAEHVDDHNALHAFYNAQSGSSVTGPDTPPSSPNAADQEFDATSTSLPSGWSWVNQRTSTYREALGVGVLDIATSGSAGADDVIGIVRNVAAGSAWTLTAKFSNAMIRSIGSAFPALGIVLRESSSGKLTTFWAVALNSANFFEVIIDHYTNPTTWSSRPGSAVNPWPYPPGVFYLRLRKLSATSYELDFSPDGAAWFGTHTGINVSTHQTPDQMGFVVNTRGSSAGEVGCHWMRVT